MCGIGQTEISVRVKAVTPNHGSCSIQVLFVPGLGFSLVASLLTKTPRLEALPLATSRKQFGALILQALVIVFCLFFIDTPRVSSKFPRLLWKNRLLLQPPSQALRFSKRVERETRATLECKGPREGEKWKAVFFIERDVWVLGSTRTASYDPASIKANVLPLNVPKGSLLGGVATEEFTVIFLQFLSLWGNW